jgi:hypothetical protein
LKRRAEGQKEVEYNMIKHYRSSFTSVAGTSYSASICQSIGPNAFRKMEVFHTDHQSLKPSLEKVKDRPVGIGSVSSSKRLIKIQGNKTLKN